MARSSLLVVFHSYGSFTSMCLRNNLTEKKHRGATEVYLGSKHSCAAAGSRHDEEQ